MDYSENCAGRDVLQDGSRRMPADCGPFLEKRRASERTCGMNRINVHHCKTAIGELILGSFDHRLCLLDFRHRTLRSAIDNRIRNGLAADFTEQDDEVLLRTRRQIGEYLDGKRTHFDVPILLVGTDFQKAVWKVVMQVPYGRTATYADVAKAVGDEKAARAVGSANGANSIAIIVPCHRIVGRRGELVGYGGGLAVKKRLLRLEHETASAGEAERTREADGSVSRRA